MKDIFLSNFLIFCSILCGITISTITIYKEESIYEHVGRKGTILLSFKDNDYFNSLEIINKNVLVKDTLENIEDKSLKYQVDCGLWKEKNEPLYYFCNINEAIPEGKYNLFFTKDFKFNNDDIHISDESGGEFYIDNYSIIDLYSLEHQNIHITDDISEGNDKYTFKFNIVSYEEQKVFLKITTFNPLDCIKNNTDEFLYCSIDKEILNGQIASNTDNIEFYSLYKGVFKKFYLIPKISLNFTSQKENEYIGITKLLTPYVAYPAIIAYETNITNFPYIYTKIFRLNFTFVYVGIKNKGSLNCSFVKFKLTPLRIICKKMFDFELTLDEIKEEFIFNDLNYKYDFRIQPVKNEEKINILKDKYNSYVYWINPNHLDFRNNKSYTIDIVGNFTRISLQTLEYIGVSFNENEEELKCEYLENLKTCNVSFEHFNGLKNGYHYLRDVINKDTKLISYEAEPIKVTLAPLTVEIKEIVKNEIGQKGTIIFKTYVEEFISIIDTEKKEIFEHVIINKNDNTKNYNISCGFWKGEIIGNSIYVFCDLNESIPEGDYYIQFNNSIFYSYYNVLLLSDKYDIKKTNEEKIDIYSGKQILEISDEKETYNLTFKVFSYYSEKLFLKINTESFLECEQNKTTNELLCSIDKYVLENQISNENQKLSLSYVDKKGSKNTFYLVDEIKIKFGTYFREILYVSITKLLTLYAELGGNIAYDTNINSDISYIYTPSFELPFDGINNNLSCNLIKTDEYIPLRIICFADKYYDGPLSLKETKEEINLGEISYKYNYRIKPIENKEQFNLINSFTNKIYYISPKILNFTQSTLYSIEIFGDFKADIKFEWISFNNKSSSNLKCENIGVIKKCNITKEHFDGVNTGLFHLYHENDQKQKFLSYEVSPINAILEIVINIDEIKVGEIGKKGTFIFSSICPKTISSSLIDVEKKEIFDVKIFNENDKNNNYSIKCGLWKFYEDLYTFCNVDETIPKGDYIIKFDDIIVFNNYKILLKSEELKIKKSDKNIIDLHSDKQVINIEAENETKTELKFQIIPYNNEELFLYINNIIPLNCAVKNNELLCSFETKQIQAQVISKNTKVSLLAKDNTGKLYEIYLVSFEFNYNLEKTPVYVYITKHLRNNVLINDYIAYETNVTNIQPLISDEFEMLYQVPKGDKFKCKFIKGENTSLNMICNITVYQNYPKLEDLNDSIILDNIYYKYKFIITNKAVPKDNSVFMKRQKYPKILGVLPTYLNFNEKEEIDIEIFLDLNESPENLADVTFDELSGNLNCKNLVNTKKCVVPKNHFSQKKSGFYYFMHGPLFISYEIFQLKVDIPFEPDSGDGNTILKIVIPSVAVFVVILIAIIVCICIKRRRKRMDGDLIKNLGEDIKLISM